MLGTGYAQSLEREVLGTVGGYLEGMQVHLSYTGGETATQTYTGSITLTQGFQQATETEVVSIDDQIEVHLDYQVFPNPTSGPLQVILSSDELLDMKLSIVDALGRATPLQAQQLYLSPGASQQTQFDLSDLASGIYILQLQDVTGRNLKSFRIVRQ